MKLIIWICSFLWYYRVTSLPQLYYNVSKRKPNLPVKVFRTFEKCAEKVVKWNLDIHYFEDCLRLGLFPDFLKFKCPKLKVYKELIHSEILKKQINI